MIKRFQIEEILSQDSTGVAFLALDTETGSMVTVRRLFPYGAKGGGFQPEEQAAYNLAVERFEAVNHPALRAVVCGGCDPVDGMPYIVTEWTNGDLLNEILQQEPLSPKVAIQTITQLLEVNELLSHVFAQEAIWVETGLDTVVDGDETSGRRFTFGISPLKWMGGAQQTSGFDEVITFAEEIMGWKDRSVHESDGLGLAAWIKWLRNAASTTTLKEAREKLAASIISLPPAPTKHIVARPVIRPQQPLATTHGRKKISSIRMRLILVGVTLVFAGLGGYWWGSLQKYPWISDFRISFGKPAPTPTVDSPELELPPVETQAGAVIQWDNREALIQQAKQEITLEGVARGVGSSGSGKTLYLLFAPEDDKEAARVGLVVKDVYPETIRENLKLFVNQKVRVKGTMSVRNYSGSDRLELVIDNLSAIKGVE